MNSSKIKDTISGCNTYPHTTFSIYGLTIILIDNLESFKDLELTVVDHILNNARSICISGKDYRLIIEGKESNYYQSHFFNFQLNLMVYVGLNRFTKRSDYRKREIKQLGRDIIHFLEHEINKLTDFNEKTVGFELVVGKYINQIPKLYRNKNYAKIISKRRERLSRKSPILIYTAEGLDKDILSQIDIAPFIDSIPSRSMIANSPEASILLAERATHSKEIIVNKIKDTINEHGGLPAFWQSEYFNLFWMTEILSVSNQIDSETNKLLFDKLKLTTLISDGMEGSMNKKKGFSIAKGFSLYDLDTTAMGIRALAYIGIDNHQLEEFNYNYYLSNGGKYQTYPNDNRESVTTIAHTLSAQIIQRNVDPNIVNQLLNLINRNQLSDKWHTSRVYVLFTILHSLIELRKFTNDYVDVTELVLRKLMTYKSKNSMSFTSLNLPGGGTIEETCWAILSIYHYLKSSEKQDKYLTQILKGAIEFIKEERERYLTEKLWVVKIPYRPYYVVDTLINCCLGINI
ncbi:MAG: hypothetical protein QY330_02635 [Candidatus Dojkabacteria bacterium]|nr:MAG: hypothetical protein QY330_02635 [Candidatus Dojkabacteria bacterium]